MIIDTEFNSAAQVSSKLCVDAAVLAEERGFGCVWKGESNSRDPIVLPVLVRRVDDPAQPSTTCSGARR